MNILKAAATVGSFTGLSRITGLVREILMSHFLGSSLVSTAFIVAFRFPNFFRRFFGEGAFNAAFVPLFAGELETKGYDAAKKTATDVFRFMSLFLTFFSIIVILFTPYLLFLLAPGYSSEGELAPLTTNFIRITFSYILFMSLTALLGGILNSLNLFAKAAAAPILLNLIMIAAYLMTQGKDQITIGYGLCFAILIAGIAQFLWLYHACAQKGYRLSFGMPSLSPQVKKVLTLMVPGIIGASVMQINIFIDMFLASFLPPTAITYLHYADRLNQLPLSIFGIAIGTALLPLLSKQIRSNHKQAATHTAKSALELSLQLTAPSTVGLIVLCYPIIKLIYGHGCFNDNDVLETAPTLAAFACGLPAYVMGKVLQTCFFAEQDTKTPLYVALGTILLNLILNLILIRFFAHVGLALSTALASWVNIIVMAIILSKRDHFHFFTKAFIFYSLKVIFAAFVMGGFLLFFQKMVYFPTLFFLQICYIGLEIIVGGMLFLLLSYFLKTLTLLKYLKTKK